VPDSILQHHHNIPLPRQLKISSEFSDKRLNWEIFCMLKEASVLIEQGRRHYNGIRPHRALGSRPPATETIAFPVVGFTSPWNLLETPEGF
jgi:hypothetical protein